MAAIPEAFIHEPKGFGTWKLESLTGYCTRIATGFCVPTGIFIKRGLDRADTGTQPVSHYNAVVSHAPEMNGTRKIARDVVQGARELTDQQGLRRLTYLSFVESLGFSDHLMLAARRRWCSLCWGADGERPYERKVWWLSVVDVCPEHRTLLEDRCPTCGFRQPAIPKAVYLHTCSYCGYDLTSTPVPIGDGEAAKRLLWYAMQGAFLVQAAEVVELLFQTAEAAELPEPDVNNDVPPASFDRLAAYAKEREVPGVDHFFEHTVRTKTGFTLEGVLSALWRLELGVDALFSPRVREASYPPGWIERPVS